MTRPADFTTRFTVPGTAPDTILPGQCPTNNDRGLLPVGKIGGSSMSPVFRCGDGGLTSPSRLHLARSARLYGDSVVHRADVQRPSLTPRRLLEGPVARHERVFDFQHSGAAECSMDNRSRAGHAATTGDFATVEGGGTDFLKHKRTDQRE